MRIIIRKNMQERFMAAIKEMKQVDQGLRVAISQGITQENYLVYLADQVHNRRLHRLLKEFGYPNTEMVGEEGMKDFWLLVQHQDGDLRLQKDCLEKCNFAPKEKAHLIDRIKVNGGEEQEYGTQLQMDENKKLTPKPIRESEDVDSRRKGVGLEPLSEYVDRVNKKYG